MALVTRASRSPLRFLRAIAAAIVVLGIAPSADAAGEKDKDALKLHDKAMDDYLATDFAKAEAKLRSALKTCGKSGCSAQVVGKLHVTLGTVLGVSGKMDQARDEFVTALKADPKAALNKDLTTPELEKTFKEAQKQAGGAAGPAPSGGEEQEGPTPTKPGGDLNHAPPAEQAINTPVPIYVELPQDIEASKVVLRYKPFGGSKYKSLEMKRVGRGFGAEIPCDDVTTTGDIKYYVVAQDESGAPVATGGTAKDPYKVPIKNQIEGEPPHLPGKGAPAQCRAKEDCPPGLPGCPEKGQRGDKGWGASCEETKECQEGLVCLNGSCEQGEEGAGAGAAKGAGKRNLVGVWGQFDLLFLSGADNVCSPENTESHACFLQDTDQQFFGQPATQEGTNGVQGGLKLASVRFLLSYDRQLLEKLGLTLGLRVGYALGGSPTPSNQPPTWVTSTGKKVTDPHAQALSFLPLHLEGRIGYVFGGSPLEKGKVRPYAFVGGGLAQVNGSVPVQVCDSRELNGTLVDPTFKKGQCQTGTKSRALDAYQITGRNFIGFGGGATYGITPFFGVGLELKAMIMIPTSGFVLAPSLGPVFGF